VFRVALTPSAERDLEAGYRFYEMQAEGLGAYFLGALVADIDGLQTCAGIHPRSLHGFHRALSHRFPFAIYYEFDGTLATVVAVLDCRRNPESITKRLG
jgi:plasmid stabilization system protein ParE